MESKIIIRNVHITPKKLRLLVANLTDLTPNAAVEYLRYTPRKSARIVYKALGSAIAAATAKLSVDSTSLSFVKVAIDEGSKLKRYQAGARGTARQFARRFSHISITLKAKESGNVAKSKAKGAPKELSTIEPQVEKNAVKVAAKPTPPKAQSTSIKPKSKVTKAKK